MRPPPARPLALAAAALLLLGAGAAPRGARAQAAAAAAPPPACRTIAQLMDADPRLAGAPNMQAMVLLPPNATRSPITVFAATRAAVAAALERYVGLPPGLGVLGPDGDIRAAAVLGGYHVLLGAWPPAALAAARAVNTLTGVVQRNDYVLGFSAGPLPPGGPPRAAGPAVGAPLPRPPAPGAPGYLDYAGLVVTGIGGGPGAGAGRVVGLAPACNGLLYVLDGMPTPAERAGALYLPRSLEDRFVAIDAAQPYSYSVIYQLLNLLSGWLPSGERAGVVENHTPLVPPAPPCAPPAAAAPAAAPAWGAALAAGAPATNATGLAATFFLPSDAAVAAAGLGGGAGAGGGGIPPEAVLYNALPRVYCPGELEALGEANSLLGELTATYLPVRFAARPDGVLEASSPAGGPPVAVDLAPSSAARVRACGSALVRTEGVLAPPAGAAAAWAAAGGRWPAALPTAPPRGLLCAPPLFVGATPPGAAQFRYLAGGAAVPAPAGAPAGAAAGAPAPGSGSGGVGAGLAAGLSAAAAAGAAAAAAGYAAWSRRGRARGAAAAAGPPEFDVDDLDREDLLPGGGGGSGSLSPPGGSGSLASLAGSRGSKGSVARAAPAPGPAAAAAADVDWAALDPGDVEVAAGPDGRPVPLGAGFFGSVVRGVRGAAREPVALKCVPLAGGDARALGGLLREVLALRRCAHANVVALHGASLAGGALVIVTELMEGGDLARRLPAPEYRWRARGAGVAAGVAAGLAHLHAAGLVHFDVKPQVLLDARGGHAKVSDLGVSRFTTQGYAGLTSPLGTFCYSAPEVLLGERCTSAADVFSFGVLLWEIATGELAARGRMRELRVPAECPPEVAALQRRCMAADPKARPTMAAVCAELAALGAGR